MLGVARGWYSYPLGRGGWILTGWREGTDMTLQLGGGKELVIIATFNWFK